MPNADRGIGQLSNEKRTFADTLKSTWHVVLIFADSSNMLKKLIIKLIISNTMPGKHNILKGYF